MENFQPNDRSRVFNNAGARMMMTGNYSMALDLFRGALESKLARERFLHPARGGDMLFATNRCVTPDSMITAQGQRSPPSHEDPAEVEEEAQEEVFDASSREQTQQPTESVAPGVVEETAVLHGNSVPEESRGFSPFLYPRPFEIPDGGTGSSSSSELTSAVIIFNLGLVHQRMNRNSSRAGAFYEISAALLASTSDLSESAIMLKIALLNNFGVWCYENGDGANLQTCMEHLSNIVERTSVSLLDQEVTEGIRANICWLLTPPNGGSPAA